jgi:hypothetical protein
MSESTPLPKQAQAASSAAEPLREVLIKLLQGAEKLPDPQKQLVATIRDLALAAKDPDQFNDTSVQRKIATIARDFEKVTAGRSYEIHLCRNTCRQHSYFRRGRRYKAGFRRAADA